MNTTCECCGCRIYGDPPISDRNGAFCGIRCFYEFRQDVPEPTPDMTRCDHCSSRLDEPDAITNRRGTFCCADCDEKNRRESWMLADPEEPGVPVLSDEADIPEIGLIDTSSFCHP